MTPPAAERAARVTRLLAAARRLAAADDPLGRRARELLPGVTGLSPEGVEYALTHCLELDPSPVELASLHGSVVPVARAHVVLAANVFAAAHRAIALALSAAPQVEVRASRREPAMASLLHQASDGLFRLVDEIGPRPSDHVWAYGHDHTLQALRGDLPAGVVLHAHGDGLGVAVIRPPARGGPGPLAAAARSLARDVIAFDQRGCLSPRVALLVGDAAAAGEFQRSLAAALADLEREVPRGTLAEDEQAALAWLRETMLFVGEVAPAGRGLVTLDVDGERWVVPAGGRAVHVLRCDEPTPLLRRMATGIAAAGVSGSPEVWEAVRAALPRARISALGMMQRPTFDGPVDRRPDPAGEIL